MFKKYEIEEDKPNAFVRNTNVGNAIDNNDNNDNNDNISIEWVDKYKVRKTMLKVCNKTLNIKYTMSATKDTIKSFLYFKDNVCLFVIQCKGYRELDQALKFHKKLAKCKTKQELKELLNANAKLMSF